MDLLDSVPEEARDQAQAYRLGLLEPEGRETPSVLLARMPSSRSCRKDEQLASIFPAIVEPQLRSAFDTLQTLLPYSATASVSS